MEEEIISWLARRECSMISQSVTARETDAYSLALSCGDRTSPHARADLVFWDFRKSALSRPH